VTKKSDSKRDYVFLFLKGAGMGAADVVPGVSGGTIAFITGIYTRFLAAIKSVNLEALKLLRKSGFRASWHYIDGPFLLTVFAGLITSAVSLAKVITYLLANHQLLVWSFFFGLILASFIYIAKQIERWRINTIASCTIGIAVAFIITSLAPTEAQPHTWLYFISGAIAVCAMVLPGISGSFILLLLGMYGHVLTAITNRELSLIILFLLGCIVGLMLFSRFLSWLLNQYQQITFALLAGFLLGSLNLLWPWKLVVSTYISSSGVEKPLIQKNILPVEYESLVGHDPQTLLCIGLAVFGLLLILSIEKLSAR
jgi:putative membrane protein